MALLSLSSLGLLLTIHPEGESRLTVAITIPPLAEFVEAIGGEMVEVLIMVPSGASPHTYEPTLRQLSRLSRADLYIMVGSGLEFERLLTERLRSVNPSLPLIDASEGIDPIRDDPHVWLSPRCAMIIVENTYKALVELDAEHADYYEKNKDQYLKRLRELESKFVEVLSRARIKKILVYHPAWGYLCRDYDLEQLSIEREGKEPSPKWIEQLVEEAKRSGIKVLLSSPHSNPGGVKAIAEELGAEVIEIDPLAQDYIENMYRVLEALEEALGVG
jgi:zinc transport system substrate-binding protein